MKLKIGIAGYGNIGKGVEKAISKCPDMELAAVFTRRDPEKLRVETPKIPVYALDEAKELKDDIDVMVLCGGSAKDLPEQAPKLAALFNIVDTFDTHSKIPEYFAAVDKAAADKTAVISAGWDPGLFSMIRMMSQAVLPEGENYTFWGRGVSQGHSDAIRKVEGVKNAVQYTVPIEEAVDKVRSGANPRLSARQKMKRECCVVAAEDADLKKIEEKIITMPDYFADYDTTVTFITEEELLKNHSKMPHGGFVLYSGSTGENRHVMEFSLKLGSNPEFTACVVLAYARAAARMAKEKNFGAKTVFDVPLSYLSPKDRGTLIKELL
ncbi:MAG: diaminopimelate dehydrogenase [Oscillospiraceae bacterium]|nr:diaminopimelate dehydrogenase [Oscillospiraceae bacterium]